MDEPGIGGLAFVRGSKLSVGYCEAFGIEHRLGAATQQL
ncbi:MAG: hypothetical protein ACJAR2_001162 [Ilumatobacter sp.]